MLNHRMQTFDSLIPRGDVHGTQPTSTKKSTLALERKSTTDSHIKLIQIKKFANDALIIL